jgi:lysophospholipase L1-like esterase
LVFSLLLAATGGLARYFWFERSAGAGPAGAAVPAEPFQQVWTRRPVLLLGLGDSVTAGFGASPGKSYFQRLARNPTDELPELRGLSLSAVLPNLRSRNRSISGTESPQHLDRQIGKLPVFDRDTFGLVVMTTGGNDLIHSYGRSAPREGAMYGATLALAEPWIAGFETRLETMVTELRRRFPGGMRLFLANIYDPTDGDGTAGVVGLPPWPDGLKIHAAYNSVIERVADRHPDVVRVDIRTPLLGHGIYCRQFWRKHYARTDPTYWYDPNFEDPNDRGYDAIRRAFLNEIAAHRAEIGA